MKISEFANKAGVTVKTLLHYDKMGLLKPSRKTDSGYRVYCDEDFLKLQQISTLRFIGLSLNEIKHILNTKGENLASLIDIQKEALERKRRHIESVIAVFNRAEAQVYEKGAIEAGKLIDIIRITNMENKVKEQYKTAENLKARFSLHSYNVNKADWDVWCFNQMQFPQKAKVLELGCGTGGFWYKNRDSLNEDWSITLSDFSAGMLQSARNALEQADFNFTYEEIDAQNIPYKDESFDVVIARHMLYLVPDIEKALSEVRRVLVRGGLFYATTNSCDTMIELNRLMDEFDPGLGMNNNGMCDRFDMEGGESLIKKYFGQVEADLLQGKLAVNDPEPIISYKASTIRGKSVLTGEKKKAFEKFVESRLKEEGSMEITTKSCIFKAKK